MVLVLVLILIVAIGINPDIDSNDLNISFNCDHVSVNVSFSVQRGEFLSWEFLNAHLDHYFNLRSQPCKSFLIHRQK